MNKILLRTFKILKYIIIITFLAFSIYVSTIKEYASYDFFSRFFTAPFIYIVKNVAELSNFVFLGIFLAILIYFLVYGTISRNTFKMLTSTKDFLKGYANLFKIKNTNERYEAMIDFLFDEKTITLIKGIVSFLFVPLSILAFKGITIDSFSFLSPSLNYSFLWLLLNEYDPYFITPLVVLLFNIAIPSIRFYLSRKDKKLDDKIIYAFQIIVSLLAVGTSFVSVIFSFYLITFSIFSYIFKLFNYLLKDKTKKNETTINVASEEKSLEEKSQEQNC